MKLQARLRRVEIETQADDVAPIWIAHQVEQSDNWDVTAVGSDETRRMTGTEIERTLTGTVIAVARTKKGGL